MTNSTPVPALAELARAFIKATNEEAAAVILANQAQIACRDAGFALRNVLGNRKVTLRDGATAITIWTEGDTLRACEAEYIGDDAKTESNTAAEKTRGPGRPPGAKNKEKTEGDKAATAAPKTPDAPPATDAKPAAPAAETTAPEPAPTTPTAETKTPAAESGSAAPASTTAAGSAAPKTLTDAEFRAALRTESNRLGGTAAVLALLPPGGAAAVKAEDRAAIVEKAKALVKG